MYIGLKSTLYSVVFIKHGCANDGGFLFEKIISEIRYPYAMAHSLHKKLAENHIPNNCLEIFEEIEGRK